MRSATILAGLLGILLTGCGGYKPDVGVVVTGKIVKGGQPLSVPNMDTGEGFVATQLFPVVTQAGDTPPEGANGTYNKSDGSVKFEYAGRGIKPGKYRLIVDANDGANDVLGGKFAVDQSKIEITVPENKVGGTYDFGTIDLDSPPAAAP